MKTRTFVSLLTLVIALLFMTVSSLGQVQSDDSDTSRPAGKIIFEIGQEDNSDREFRKIGLSGIKEYRCRVGVDCSTETFPAYLILAGYTEDDYGGVEHITIIFKLKRNYNNVILRLARGGDETTVVRVDGKQTHLVTNTMLGSGEGFRVGIYNLKLGALKKGEHTIEMTVADDGKGNYGYQWDALSLFAKKR